MWFRYFFLAFVTFQHSVQSSSKLSNVRLANQAVDKFDFNTNLTFFGNIDEQFPDVKSTIRQRAPSAILRSGVVGDRYRWTQGVIPFTIDTKFDSHDVAVIRSAMTEIESKTCIRFLPRNPTSHPQSVHITKGNTNSGCWSYLGRTGSAKQTLNLESGPGRACMSKGIIMHELMHTIGFIHEQSRPDRDDFVSINFANVRSGFGDQFQKQRNTNDFGVGYDLESIMHYSAYAFSKNGRPTIVPKQNVALSRIGQRRGFSDGDIRKVARVYSKVCPSTSISERYKVFHFYL